jgi:hypothetical protein
MSATRRVGQKVAAPVVGYVDRMFATVHHRLDELFDEVSQGRRDLAAVDDDLKRAVGLEIDVLHEVVLGLERRIVELTERIDDLEGRARDDAERDHPTDP